MMFNWLNKLLTQKGEASEGIKKTIVDEQTFLENNNAVPEGYALMSGFGYKINWYMIPENELNKRSWTIKDLANAINIKSQQKISWSEGVKLACQPSSNLDEIVYISAPYEGWVYILKGSEEKLDLLNDIVDNYYAFGSYRVVDYIAWKHVVDNKVVRYFVSSCGDVWKNVGLQTSEESKLKYVDLSGLDEANELIYSVRVESNDKTISFFDEEHVIDICEAWTGINPCNFDSQPVPVNCLPNEGISGVLEKRVL